MQEANKLRVILKSEPYANRQMHDWKKLYLELGTELPSDYVELITLYGSGTYLGFLRIFQPFTDNKNFELRYRHRLWCSLQEDLKSISGGAEGITAYPENTGLLLWGDTIDGNPLCWNCEGRPDDWKIVAVDTGTSQQWIINTNIIGMLERMLAGEYLCDVVSDTYDKHYEPRYIPSPP